MNSTNDANDSPDGDPLAPYRSTRVPRDQCKCPEDMRVPLSGDGWLCGDCGADVAAPPSVQSPSTEEPKTLHMFDVYGAEEEVVIAYDEADARVFMLTMVKPEDLEDACFDEFEDDDDYTRRDENNVPVTKTVAEWCKQEGRGYFASCYA